MVRASLLVGHDALGRGNNCNAETLEDSGQLVSTGVNAQTGLGDSAKTADDLFLASEILQLDADDTLGTVFNDLEGLDVAFVEQDLCDCLLQVGSRDIHRLMFCRVCIPDTGQHIGNGISDLHLFFLLV